MVSGDFREDLQAPAPPEVTARLLRVVLAMVEETRPGRALGRVSLHSHLERDLGLDSLARVELLLRVGSEFGKSLPEGALAEAETPQDLLRFIACADTGSFVQTDVEPASSPTGVDSSPTGVPESARTLVEVLEWHAERHPQRPHVLLYGDGGGEQGEFRAETISYGQLLEQARRVATGLVSRGLLPRQAVALMLPTGRDYLTSFFGVMLAGGIPVPIYPPARLAQIEDHLRRHARILANAEAVRRNPASTKAELLAQKAILERVNLADGG